MNMVSIQFGKTINWIESTMHNRVMLIFEDTMRIVNYDSHQQQKKRLSPLRTSREEILWVYLDLLKDEQ